MFECIFSPGVVSADVDLNGDRVVDEGDPGTLLGSWEADAGGDLDGDGATGPSDLGILLANWRNACP
ncbi:MAG: hypothetical protein U1D55_06250 [Phycisphaerae bacterium]